MGGCGTPGAKAKKFRFLLSFSFSKAMIWSIRTQQTSSLKVQTFLAQAQVPEQHLQSLAQAHLEQQQVSLVPAQELLVQHFASQQQEVLAVQGWQQAPELHAVPATGFGQEAVHDGIEQQSPAQEFVPQGEAAQVPQPVGFSLQQSVVAHVEPVQEAEHSSQVPRAFGLRPEITTEQPEGISTHVMPQAFVGRVQVVAAPVGPEQE
jgi:hypothetical protein